MEIFFVWFICGHLTKHRAVIQSHERMHHNGTVKCRSQTLNKLSSFISISISKINSLNGFLVLWLSSSWGWLKKWKYYNDFSPFHLLTIEENTMGQRYASQDYLSQPFEFHRQFFLLFWSPNPDQLRVCMLRRNIGFDHCTLLLGS